MFFGGFLCRSNYDQKKRYSRLAVGWNVLGFHELGLFRQVPQSNYNRKKGTVVWPLVAKCRIVLTGLSLCFLAGSLIKLQITTRKKRYSWPSYSSITYTHSSGELIIIKINTESEYNSNLQIGMALSIK